MNKPARHGRQGSRVQAPRPGRSPASQIAAIARPMQHLGFQAPKLRRHPDLWIAAGYTVPRLVNSLHDSERSRINSRSLADRPAPHSDTNRIPQSRVWSRRPTRNCAPGAVAELRSSGTESPHLLYDRNGLSVIRRHGIGTGQRVQNLKIVRVSLARAFERRQFLRKIRRKRGPLRGRDRYRCENQNHATSRLLSPIPVARSEIEEVSERCDEIHAKTQHSYRRRGQHHTGGFPSAAGVGEDEDARCCQNGFQPDTDPKYFMVEEGKVQKKDRVAHFFKKRNKVNPTQAAAEPAGVILAPWRPILFVNPPLLSSGRGLRPGVLRRARRPSSLFA